MRVEHGIVANSYSRLPAANPSEERRAMRPRELIFHLAWLRMVMPPLLDGVHAIACSVALSCCVPGCRVSSSLPLSCWFVLMLIAYFALRASLLSEPLFCLVCLFVSCLSLGILRPEVASDCFGQLFCSYILISTHHLVHFADRLLFSNYIYSEADVSMALACFWMPPHLWAWS